jgi:5-methylcytosine-specific restriction endonuclease McrA
VRAAEVEHGGGRLVGKASKREVWKLKLDVEEFFLRHTFGMTVGQVGEVLRDLLSACERVDTKYLNGLPFVAGVFCHSTSVREYIPAYLRREVLSAGQCANCGSPEQLTVDHIKPVIFGGRNIRRNLQCLCWTCNRKKGPQAWTARTARTNGSR